MADSLVPDQPALEMTSSESSDENDELSRQLPIPPASEPKQYRAIGLIYGKYVPSEEQFTRGNLITEKGLEIDSVLLGRVMSLVKKHIDLEKHHLWVVYPRTRNKDRYLHAQVVGVWEPEKLNRVSDSTMEDAAVEDAAVEDDSSSSMSTEVEASSAAVALSSDLSADIPEVGPTDETDTLEPEAVETEAVTDTSTENEQSPDTGDPDESTSDSVEPANESGDDASTSPAVAVEQDRAESVPDKPLPFLAGDQEMLRDGYFSIRGEVVKASDEENEVTVKIRQAPRKGTTQERSFNLVLKGKLEGRVTGYFWDLNVQRDGTDLVIQDGTMIGIVLPKKRDKNAPSGRGGPRGRGGPPGKRRWNSNSRLSHGDRPERPEGPRRQPISKARKAGVEKPQPKTN
ncbi:MAG: hypothetical protein AAF327_23015 [Cyanobacteria bacterium P01_A01_bin.37]